ncbi:PTS lactose/cellobiose transporter subunit IIA [Mycoplasma sp. Ms02]|uniref:PTS lactose/cellobiose transporter subunit IIA n=1 Tax=Mycoplasma sp. Ms02 TaxID=353851 RepID=UPI001C88ED6E|nr:PTS lactose/cellobiose transporter subunit IIA [Mycoplasma sp. Ms02]QZE12313.1 PTS lactose/cellobiose transporter subunit IIA [Mycoplasma sp. Ms02]
MEWNTKEKFEEVCTSLIAKSAEAKNLYTSALKNLNEGNIDTFFEELKLARQAWHDAGIIHMDIPKIEYNPWRIAEQQLLAHAEDNYANVEIFHNIATQQEQNYKAMNELREEMNNKFNK